MSLGFADISGISPCRFQSAVRIKNTAARQKKKYQNMRCRKYRDKGKITGTVFTAAMEMLLAMVYKLGLIFFNDSRFYNITPGEIANIFFSRPLGILKENNCKIAIVSNKADAFVKNLVNTFFRGYVDISIGQNEKIRQKPHSDMVEYALRNLNIAKNDSVYLGDSEVDIETAKNSGLDCICVSWGFRSREQLLNSGAKIIVDSPLQIPNYMDVNND